MEPKLEHNPPQAEQVDALHELSRLNRLYSVLSHVNETVARTPSRDELFRRVCEIAVKHGGFTLAWIGERNTKTQAVLPVAVAGGPVHYVREIRVYADDRPEGHGPVGTAIREARHYICNNLYTDAHMAPWRRLAENAGLCSLAAFPCYLGGKVWGALTLYSSEVGFFQQNEVDLLDQVALDISFGMDRIEEEGERRRAEEALHESRENYRALVENTPDIIARFDRRCRYLFANSAITRLAGHKPESLIGKTMRSAGFSREQAAICDEVVRRVFATGESAETEFEFVGASGRQDFEWRLYPEFDTAGKVMSVLSIAREITERKIASRALSESEDRYRRFVRMSSEGVWRYDLDKPLPLDLDERKQAEILLHGTYVGECNDVFARQFGYHDARQVVGVRLDDLGTGTLEEKIEQILKFIRLGYRVNDALVRHVDASGRVTWALGNLIGIVEDDHLTCVWGTQRDVTEYKRAEERIRQQANLIDLAQDAIVARDLEDRVFFWNRGAERLYGWTAAEAIGATMTELLHWEAPALEAARVAVMENGEWAGEVRHATKDGRELIVNSRWSLVRNAENVPQAILAINTDITEKKELEAQFLRAQRMQSVGTLAGGIAHDLNNILSPILMLFPLLRQRIDDEETVALLDTTEASVERGASIIRQILTFSRGLRSEKVPLQSYYLLKEVRSITQETFPKSIVIRMNVPRDLWLIEADATQLHQVLMNLCVNARDAMPDGGTLALTATNMEMDDATARTIPNAKAGRYVVWSVSDTGTGISPADLDRIFDPFFTTKEMGKGTGLGLSTVLGIVNSHEGCIQVWSEVGKGTEFKVYFPATTESEHAAVPQADLHEPGATAQLHGRGEHILVVDDEEAVRDMARLILTKYDYNVLLARDGAEAIGLYRLHADEISLVLTDLLMPGIDGRAATAAIRRLNPGAKVIVMSGLMSDAQTGGVNELGVRGFLTKPFRARTLLETVRRVLDEKDLPTR